MRDEEVGGGLKTKVYNLESGCWALDSGCGLKPKFTVLKLRVGGWEIGVWLWLSEVRSIVIFDAEQAPLRKAEASLRSPRLRWGSE